jgi:hypothetical protein
MATADSDKKWWYNHTTGEVEYGRKSLSMHRDGPYDTEEEAKAAPEIARRRAERWAEEEARDSAWRPDGEH